MRNNNRYPVNVEILTTRIKELLSLMSISNAILIDDKIGQNENVEAAELILSVIQGDYESPEFDVKEEIRRAGFDLEEVAKKAEHGEVDKDVLEICLRAFPEQPDIGQSEIQELVNVIQEIFGEEHFKAYTNSSEVQQQGLNSDTILFLDYKLDGSSPKMSQDLIKVLAEHDGQNKPKCIIFISKDPILYIEEKGFSMDDPIQKSKYLREIKKLQAETNYKNSLYDFISKHSLDNKAEILESLFEALQNLHGGQIFYELLKVIDNVLLESSQSVLDKFYLLNARSLQELLNNKVENEGLAKPVFLMEWISRHIAKSVIRNNSITKKIDEKLRSINQSKYLINEFHEDVTLREIINSEMWDDSINKRHEPIDFGDVFEIECNGVNSKAILMTQTCTIAVRKDGKRATKTGMLVLEKEAKGDILDEESNSPRYISIYNWGNEKITFSLDDTITFSLEILDLTTLNEDGYAAITVLDKSGKVELPEAFWADGYKDKMNKLGESLVKIADTRKYGTDVGFMPIEQSWLEFKINKSENGEKHIYKFPIKRIARLDSKYAMHIFQKAQSWWGRIGLPVQLDIIDEYRPKQGSIQLNNISSSITLFEKRGKNQNDVIDCCIDLQEFATIVSEIYKDNIELIDQINEIFSVNKIIKYNCSSGKRLLSLKESKDGILYLNRFGIFIELCIESHSGNKNMVIAKLPFFSKCYFNENDITEKVSRIKFDQNGELRCDIPIEVIKDCTFLRDYTNLIQVEREDDKVLKFAENKLKECTITKITECELHIIEMKQHTDSLEQVSAGGD